MPLPIQVCLFIQSRPTHWDFMDCSPPGSSVHGILQARILERVVLPSNRGSSQPRDRTQVSPVAGRVLIIWATRLNPPHPILRKLPNSLTWDIWFSLTLMFLYSYYLVFAAKLLYSGSSSISSEQSHRAIWEAASRLKISESPQNKTILNLQLVHFSFSWHSLQQFSV